MRALPLCALTSPLFLHCFFQWPGRAVGPSAAPTVLSVLAMEGASQQVLHSVTAATAAAAAAAAAAAWAAWRC
jgi:hypothetical protein